MSGHRRKLFKEETYGRFPRKRELYFRKVSMKESENEGFVGNTPLCIQEDVGLNPGILSGFM